MGSSAGEGVASSCGVVVCTDEEVFASGAVD